MKELSQKLSEALSAAVERQEIAGANVLILQNGAEAAYAEAGFADKERKRPYTRDTIARIYSMTKPVTATAAMLLMERGLLDLGSPVREFLPGFENTLVAEGNTLVPARRPPRVCDLLSMTSGLGYGGPSADRNSRETEALFQELKTEAAGGNALGTLEAANRLGRCPLAFHPGESWQYGASADVLGAVIEVVSGKRFGEFLREELFEPLDMEDTGFFVPQEKQDRLARVYQQSGEALIPYRENHLGISHAMNAVPAFESGGAGLASTADDYAKLAAMLLEEGSCRGKRILSPRTVRYLTQAELLPWQQEALERSWEGLGGHTYGNLMRRLKAPGKALAMGSAGEYGWDGWLGTYFTNSPADRLTMLVSLQRKDAGTLPVTRKLKNMVWSELC